MKLEHLHSNGLNKLQKISMSIMAVLIAVTFVASNLHAILWQSSDWLVSTVLPAVVVNLTNDERADNAAGPLQRNSTLDEAAQLKAEHMAKYEYFSHFSPKGVSPWHWFDKAGYVYAYAGENLAIHFTDSSEVVDAWMKSPAHRENIVNGVYTEIGVGTAKGKYEGYNTVYVVQLFGTPAIAPAAPVVATIPEPEVVVVVEPESIFEIEELAPTEVVLAVQTEVPIVVQELAVTEVVSIVTEPEITIALNEPELMVEIVPTEAAIVPVDIVIVESSIISTSSGLAIANITTPNEGPAKSFAAIATQPNFLLQMVYMVLAAIVVMLLGTSIVVEARRQHFVQVAYGFMLLAGMGSLWYAHSLLTTGAVIV